MKLNYKRTIFVGFAFFAICAFWQLYDGIVPLILRDTFNIGDTLSGFIMSIDNILALFMLPLFGALSDKKGKRMPFIAVGTVAAAVFMILMPIADNIELLWVFITALGVTLVSMSIYRSPAVALMPAVTPKPVRSKGNAVINLMGAVGGVYTLAAIQILVKEPQDGHTDYLPVFISVAALMVVALVVLLVTINERKLVKEMTDINYGVDPEEDKATVEVQVNSAIKLDQDNITVVQSTIVETTTVANKKLAPEVKKSLILILFSVAFWFMGYNAVTTAFTKYATQVWGQTINQASNYLMIATVGAVISYIPIGFISSSIGRKKTILIGVVLLAACFAVGSFIAGSFAPILYVVFALIGFAWAAINVNSYPMVVEISKAGDIGKYTGYYYTFSMAAQIVTPILSGYLLEHVGYQTLFPYAAIMVAISFVTMFFTKHGDNKPKKLESKLEAFDVDD